MIFRKNDLQLGNLDTPQFKSNSITNGAVRPAAEIPSYVRDVVKSDINNDLPRFVFDLGTAPQSIVNHAALSRPKFGKISSNQLVISNLVIDKLYARRPKSADEMLRNLPELLSHASEVLPDHQNKSRALISRPLEKVLSGSRNQVAVLEIARSNDGIEIVSIYTAPDRTLNKARTLLKQMLQKLGR